MKHKVWVGHDLMPEPLALLEAETETIHSTNPADLPGVAGVILGVAPTADAAFMDQAGQRLKVIARHGIGVDNVDLAAATERGILVVNTPDAPTEEGAFRSNGLTDLVALDADHLLVLERSFAVGVGNRAKLYLTRLAPEAEVTGMSSAAGRPTAPKQLLVDLEQLACRPDNLEEYTPENQ